MLRWTEAWPCWKHLFNISKTTVNTILPAPTKVHDHYPLSRCSVVISHRTHQLTGQRKLSRAILLRGCTKTVKIAIMLRRLATKKSLMNDIFVPDIEFTFFPQFKYCISDIGVYNCRKPPVTYAEAVRRVKPPARRAKSIAAHPFRPKLFSRILQDSKRTKALCGCEYKCVFSTFGSWNDGRKAVDGRWMEEAGVKKQNHHHGLKFMSKAQHTDWSFICIE